jgi:hypothetical protein
MDLNILTTRGHLYGIAMEPGGVVGNSYLNEHWNRTALLLYDNEKLVEGYSARYEISNDHFEIQTAGGLKILNGKKVRSFVWVDSTTHAPHYFVNAQDLRDENDVPLPGFFEVLSEGERTLLSRTHVLVKDPTYNEKFDMGNRDTRIIKKTGYFFAEKNVVREVPSSRKKFLSIFGARAEEIGAFIRDNRLSHNDEMHLKLIFERYNAPPVAN